MQRYHPSIEQYGHVAQAVMLPNEHGKYYLRSDVEEMADRLLADKNARIAELEQRINVLEEEKSDAYSDGYSDGLEAASSDH